MPKAHPKFIQITSAATHSNGDGRVVRTFVVYGLTYDGRVFCWDTDRGSEGWEEMGTLDAFTGQ